VFLGPIFFRNLGSALGLGSAGTGVGSTLATVIDTEDCEGRMSNTDYAVFDILIREVYRKNRVA
jgi:hypothetical protein